MSKLFNKYRGEMPKTLLNLITEALVNTAKKHKCNLIVMASHGYKAFKRLLLGSETLHVLTHAHIPVLVLR